MLLETLSQEFRKARAVNQTSTTFVAKKPTKTEPAGDAGTATGASVVDLGSGGEYAQNGVKLAFYGVGSNNNTFSARVFGWSQVRNPLSTGDLNVIVWVPVLLCEVLVTLSSNIPGVTGGTIGTTELFADTIAIVGTSGNPNVSMEIVSPADDATMGHVILDVKGFKKLELTFSTGSSATDANALLTML